MTTNGMTMSQDETTPPRRPLPNGRSPAEKRPPTALQPAADGAIAAAAGGNAGIAPAILSGQDPEALAAYLLQGNLLVVNKRQRNGLLIFKEFHAEFAGPGAIVGGKFDRDCCRVIPVGKLCLAPPANHEERQEAYLIRRQWIRLTQQFTDSSGPAVGRARMILNQFETYFDARVVQKLPDEAFALLVGVFPHTVRLARRPAGKLNVKK